MRTLKDYVIQYHHACPKTKMAIIGYSSGGVIAMNDFCYGGDGVHSPQLNPALAGNYSKTRPELPSIPSNELTMRLQSLLVYFTVKRHASLASPSTRELAQPVTVPHHAPTLPFATDTPPTCSHTATTTTQTAVSVVPSHTTSRFTSAIPRSTMLLQRNSLSSVSPPLVARKLLQETVRSVELDRWKNCCDT